MKDESDSAMPSLRKQKKVNITKRLAYKNRYSAYNIFFAQFIKCDGPIHYDNREQ